MHMYTCSVTMSACKKIDRVNRRLAHQTDYSYQEQRAVQMRPEMAGSEPGTASVSRAAATAGVKSR